MYPSVYNIDIV